MSAIIVLSLLGVLLIGLNEYAREQQYKAQLKEIELDKQEMEAIEQEAHLHRHCDECFYFKKVEYVEEEGLFLCKGCK